MGLTINKPSVRKVPVRTLNLKWSGGVLERSCIACGFKCSACGAKLGERRFATAWVKDESQEYSLRLCEDCGIKAEADLIASGGQPGRMGPPE